MIDFSSVIGFDWDTGNARKNERHDVSQAEAEQIFSDSGLLTMQDEKHSSRELRYIAFGRIADERLLQVAFTLRESETLIRIISARDANRRERKTYENQD